jgi:hypothetical protein
LSEVGSEQKGLEGKVTWDVFRVLEPFCILIMVVMTVFFSIHFYIKGVNFIVLNYFCVTDFKKKQKKEENPGFQSIKF